MFRAVFDAIEDFRIEQRLAQSDQHHVFGRLECALNETREDVIRHVFFGLLMCLTRTHRAVQVALRGGFDDIFHRERIQLRLAPEISPQQTCAVHCTHEPLL